MLLRSFGRREGGLEGETSQLPRLLLRREVGMVVLVLSQFATRLVPVFRMPKKYSPPPPPPAESAPGG